MSLLLLSASVGAETLKPSAEAERIRQRLSELEKDTPFSNQNGTITVRGANLDSIDKMEVLRFAEDVRQRLQLLLGIPLTSPRFRVVITDDDVEALGGVGLAGKLCNHWLAAADIPAPAWAGYGLARWINEPRRQHYADQALTILSRDILPSATTMLSGTWQREAADGWAWTLEEWDALCAVGAHWYVKEGRLLETDDERNASWGKWVTALRLKRWLLPADQPEKRDNPQKTGA